MSTQTPSIEAQIALNRFGLGVRAGELPPADPRRWLIDQFDAYQPAPAALAGLQSTRDIAERFITTRQEFRDLDEADRLAARQELRREARVVYQQEATQRVLASLDTPAPFVERLVHFWANHFALSVDKIQVTPLVGSFEREAIRPHVLGRFEDLLLAVERHAGMQIYLDQIRSVGPNSPRAVRAEERDAARKSGINENLAREIMELHTLGVRTGYTQADVTEFALALSGWTIITGTGDDDADVGSFQFRQGLHEPGPRLIMGKTYAQPGEEQARAVLHDLATAESTATHIATKLTRHFIADDPPQAAIERVKAAFVTSSGDLPTIYRALVEAPEAWDPTAQKFKTPWDWMISSLRGIGREGLGNLKPPQLANQLGQPVWRPESPAGYDDVAASWAAPDALVKRVEIAQRLVRGAPTALDARALAPQLLPGTLSQATQTQIDRAESQPTALALLLVSPEFQRR